MIIEQLKKANLRGRSGSGFPTWLKWEAVLNAKKKTGKCFVVCNAAEGEPSVFKDGYLLEKYPEEVVNGIKIAMDALGASQGYIYIRRPYFKRFRKNLKRLIGEMPIELFVETGGYLCGEETTLLESIEGKRDEPRLRPPYPTDSGLFGLPTLINNVETFYAVSKIAKGEYKNTKFYSLSGDLKHSGVYELPEVLSIREILEQTDNLPPFKFFVQVGGGASGGLKISEEMSDLVDGAASIVVFNQAKTDPTALMKKWVNFFYKQNCGKCVPCREGVYRLRELLNSSDCVDAVLLRRLLDNLGQNSFCPFGRGVAFSLGSLLDRVELSNKINICKNKIL